MRNLFACGRCLLAVIACATLAMLASSSRADEKVKLFVAEPLTQPKEFTPGIEGPST